MKIPSSKIVRSIVVSKLKSFCEHSTLHGIYYVCCGGGGACARAAWLAVVALSAALCCFLGHMIWEKFVIDPTLTVVETTHYSMVKVEFPAVAVCDNERVFLPATQQITHLLQLRGFNESEIEEFYKSFSAVKRKGYEPEPFVKKIHSVLADIGYTLDTLLDMFKRPCEDMIVECNWRSRPYNCSELFRPVSTIVGYCCQFDIPYFRQHSNVQTNFISGTDSSEALDITMMPATQRLDPDNGSGYAMLYVFDRKDKLTLIDSYVSLIPEAYFDVNVYTWAIDSSPNVKALPLASRKCIVDSDHEGDAGFYQGCMTRLILQRVVDYCRCLPFNYTAKELGVDEFSSCAWDRLVCIYQAIDKVQVDIREVISDNECYQRCDYVQYDTEVEFLKNQRHLSKLEQGASRVQVHFSQMTCMKYRREILYTWDQVLANLGGIFGLCLGGSIISVIEIAWLALELTGAVVAAFFREPPPLPKPNNKAFFTVPQKHTTSKPSNLINVNGKYKFVN